MAHKLSEVEAFRAQVFLEESLKKLKFLTSIPSSSSVHGDELTEFMGDEISRIIQEQRDLERSYEELIAARGQLKGLCNKVQFMETQKEILVVAQRLKESNKTLCRNLKENPNVQGNLLKMQAERSQVQEWLEETKTDLIEMSFANLVSKVEAERREQERLGEVKKKEREASQTVKQLEAELHREHTENEKATKSANQEIKELKEELQKNKTISDIEFKFEEKKLRAREEALLRMHAQLEKKLLEELEELQQAQEIESSAHERAHAFLDDKIEDLIRMKAQWDADDKKETSSKEVELELLNQRREQTMQELTSLQESRKEEYAEHKQKEEQMRNAVYIEQQRRVQLQRMQEAVVFLQTEGRIYLHKVAERKAASKSKGKKKAGAKKK